MDKLNIYNNKVNLQVYNLFFRTIESFDLLSEKEIEDLYFQIKEFLTYVYRTDKTMYQDALSDVFKDEQVEDYNKIKEAFLEIKENTTKYIEYEKTLNLDLKTKLNEEFANRGFNGTYPKYYLTKEENTLIVEYDEDIYYSNEELVSKRNAIIVKIPNSLIESLNININSFTHEDLVLKYNTELTERKIKAFLIHLPDLDYSKDLNEEELIRDLKYLEIIDSVLNGVKYLPKWYIEYNKSVKDFSKTYLMIFLLVGVPTVIALTALLSFKGPLIAISIILYYLLSNYVAKIIGLKKYNKVHK